MEHVINLIDRLIMVMPKKLVLLFCKKKKRFRISRLIQKSVDQNEIKKNIPTTIM